MTFGQLPGVRADDDLLGRLRAGGTENEDAAAELHALLLRAAHFELARRASALVHVRGDEIEDLALQAADDAFVAVMAKLGEFRGDSRFSTWAYKFALYEAANRARRRSWQHREVVLDAERWLEIAEDGHGPERAAEQQELLGAIRSLIRSSLTDHQREVLVALAVQGVPIDVLADRMQTTRGALYKALHDARRRLRSELTAAGHNLTEIR